MATVLYLPPDYGGNPPGAAFGQGIGTGLIKGAEKSISDKQKKQRAEQLAKVLGSYDRSLGEDFTKATEMAPEVDSGDIVRLVISARSQKSSLTKVTAYDKTNPKRKTTFAATPEDIASGAAEKNANARNLTLMGPTEETGQKATDMQDAIKDILKKKQKPDNATNRANAREFLKNRSKAVEVINATFGKKVGNDWTFDDPIKNKMAELAKSQLEGLMFEDGMSAEVAGARASQISRDVFSSFNLENQTTTQPKPTGETSVGDLLNGIKNFFSSREQAPAPQQGTETPQQTEQGQQGQTSEQTPKTETLGDGKVNGVDISFPADREWTPKELLGYLIENYPDVPPDQLSKWLQDNWPTE